MSHAEIEALIWATSALNEAQAAVKPGRQGGKHHIDYSAQTKLLLGVILREMEKARENPELFEYIYGRQEQ
jgi:hypothetical protein